MNRKILFWPLAAVLLTACEKGLDVGVDGISTDGGQVKNSVLQVRTRVGGSVTDEATVSYPVTVYVFRGDECRAVQTIGDEGQMLNIPLVEGTYSVYAIGGASTEDYVLPDASDALTSSAIALREGHEHGDLMAASATARRWWHEHRHAGHDEEDDAHSKRDYQEDSDGGNSCERVDCAAVAVAYHWWDV